MPQKTPIRGSLQGVAILKGLDEAALAVVEAKCHWRQFARGQEILGYRAQTTDVYFITQGTARVMIETAEARTVAFRDLGPGENFGEYAAIDGGKRSATILAVEPCTVAILPAAAFRDLLSTQATVNFTLLRQLIGQVRALTARVFEFSTLAVNNRIHAELLRLAREATIEGNIARIHNMPTQDQIASRISTHREAVTREFTRLRKLGLIESRRDALVIKDVAALKKLIPDAPDE
jgi:CRP-like cAMP-binding protein